MLYVNWVKNEDLKTTAWRKEDLNGTDIIHKKIWFGKGPFKYYVIMFLTFLRLPTHLFDDLQYCKSSKIAIF